MSTPDPESVGLLAKVIAAGVAVVAPIWGARTWLDKRFEKKADKHVVTTEFQTVKNELGTLRATQAKIFDKLAESETRNEDRHREVLMYLLENKK